MNDDVPATGALGLEARIEHDLTAALRAGDETRKRTLRQARAALKNAAIEARGTLDEAAAARVLHKEAKMRRDAMEQFGAAGRADLVASEAAELAILESYLPAPLDEAAVEALARAIIARVGAQGAGGTGLVMGPLMAEIGGRADGKVVSQVVRRLLAG